MKDIKITKNGLLSNNMVIGTGNSKIHLQHVSIKLKKAFKNYENLIISGKDTEWIIIDTNSFTIHLMLDDARKLYNLEYLYNESV